MPGMYGGGMQQRPIGALPQNVMQQRPGDINAGRDRITQALMDVQNPPPVTPMLPQRGMPPAIGAPPMAGAMPSAAAPQAMGSMPGQMSAGGGGMPGQMPSLVGQGGAMPGLSGMTQPGMPSPLQRPQTPGGPTY